MSETEEAAEEIIKVLDETLIAEKIPVKKRTNKNKGNRKITCKICQIETTYQEFEEHVKTKTHQFNRKTKNREERRERKRRAKQKKVKTLPRSVVFHHHFEKERDKPVKDKYHIRHGDPLPDHHQLYINTLTAFLALRYCFSKDNFLKFFKVSTVNSAWNEFGDIVFELGNYEETTEIHAIQCKQVHSRNNIFLSTLGAEMGKFSLKTRCNILKKLRKKLNYDKTFFKLYTVSSLAIDKDTSPKFVYDDDALKNWKNKEEIELWKNRKIIIPEYKKIDLLNTTDDPDDICIFKIIDHDDTELDACLKKFSIFTNQRRLGSLKHLMNLTLKDKFPRSEDISNDLIKYVSDFFKKKKTDERCYKLTKTTFLLKVAELILTPYLMLPDSIPEEASLELWNETLQIFDVAVLAKNLDTINKVYSGINSVLKQETDFSLGDCANLRLERSKVRNEELKFEIFDDECDFCDVSLPSVYLAMWKSKLTPLVLGTDDEMNLTYIVQVISFLKEENMGVNFVIIRNNSILRTSVPKNLDVFFNLEDLRDDILKDILKKIEVDILGSTVSLKKIIDCNEDFLKKVTPDVLLNMFLKDYSFKDIYVPITEEICENTLVLNDNDIGKIRRFLQDKDEEAESGSLSYLVNFKGKTTYIQVPPDI